MREILFRGRTITGKEWVSGAFAVYSSAPFIGAPNSYGTMLWFEVDPETVGQFTGKIDKNKKKVFEHDILQLFTVWANGTVEKSGACVVKWWENDQCYVLTTKEGYHCDDFGNLGRPEYYEVIGNIHDNPELLEVGA